MEEEMKKEKPDMTDWDNPRAETVYETKSLKDLKSKQGKKNTKNSRQKVGIIKLDCDKKEFKKIYNRLKGVKNGNR